MDIDKRLKVNIENTIKKNEDHIMNKKNVVGTGIGFKVIDGKKTETPVLMVLVEKKEDLSSLKKEDVVETTINNIETDVIEVGVIKEQSNIDRIRPAIGGYSIGRNSDIASGTLGGFVRSEVNGELYILSNNHVIAANSDRTGSIIAQPGVLDAPRNSNNHIAELYRYPIIASSNNKVDCALARPTDRKFIDRKIKDFVNTPTGTASPKLKERVWKSGRTTELTDGYIEIISASLGVVSGNDIRNYENQIITQKNGKSITSPGDSGSLMINSSNEVIGLHFAGSDIISISNPIEDVLESLRYSDVKRIPGWFGDHNDGGGITSTDIRRNNKTDLIKFHIDNPKGGNSGYYRIGWDIDGNGEASGWSNVKKVPGWFGDSNEGGDIAAYDLNKNGKPDLIVFHIDNPNGGNSGYYRIGYDLDYYGNVTRGWSNVKKVPGWFGDHNAGGGIAIADLNRNGKPDLIVFHIDNPKGGNSGYYRIGRDLDIHGNVTGGWSNVEKLPGWFGDNNEGGGITIADINKNGRPDFIISHIDNPKGGNSGHYRLVYDIMPSGKPAKWEFR